MKELEVTYLGKPINVGLLERIKAYSPMFDKTFDVMTTQEQKEQLDKWIEDGFIWVNGRPYMRDQLDYADDDTEIEVMRMFAHLGGRTLNGK